MDEYDMSKGYSYYSYKNSFNKSTESNGFVDINMKRFSGNSDGESGVQKTRTDYQIFAKNSGFSRILTESIQSMKLFQDINEVIACRENNCSNNKPKADIICEDCRIFTCLECGVQIHEVHQSNYMDYYIQEFQNCFFEMYDKITQFLGFENGVYGKETLLDDFKNKLESFSQSNPLQFQPLLEFYLEKCYWPIKSLLVEINQLHLKLTEYISFFRELQSESSKAKMALILNKLIKEENSKWNNFEKEFAFINFSNISDFDSYFIVELNEENRLYRDMYNEMRTFIKNNFCDAIEFHSFSMKNTFSSTSTMSDRESLSPQISKVKHAFKNLKNTYIKKSPEKENVFQMTSASDEKNISSMETDS
jgi:hypothetical protein